MNERDDNVKALAEAFERFTETTRTMEESYRKLQARVATLDKELADKNRELALTSDYLGNILESMSDGVVAVDTDGRVTAFNRAAGDVLGFTRDAVMGKPFAEVFGRAFAGGTNGDTMELRAQDGRNVTVVERDSPLSDRVGNRIGAVKVFQDLTEIEELRERVRQKDRLAAVGEMAATVAHEIRNPLGGIRGFAALLSRDIPEDDDRRRLVDKIEAGARDLERVVGELLEYTRPVELRARVTSCVDLVEAALGYVDLKGKPVGLVNEADPAVTFMVDPDRMRQVLLNILLNAVQSIEDEGEVRISTMSDEEHITVSVSDTGCGMTQEQVEQVFMPFYTTKEKGTGLGMAVAAKIVDGHGGRLEVETRPGEGSVFHVRLPVPAAQ